MQTTSNTGQEMPPEKTEGFNRAFKPANVQMSIYTQSANFQGRYKAEREERYREALQNLPQRGGGLHGALLTVCNYGVLANIPAHVMLQEITATGRAFKRGEIEDALKKPCTM